MTRKNPATTRSGDGPRTEPALACLARSLKSQPLILALGVVLVLATVATATVDALRALLPGVVGISVLAIAAWTLVELARLRREQCSGVDEQVSVSARGVGKTGEVIGVEDQSDAVGNAGRMSVRIEAKDIQGRVAGVRRGKSAS